MSERRYDVIIVGGGAAGTFAAAEISAAGKSVLIIEPNRFLGRKLRITGKGRCNVTNNCGPDEVLKNVLRNPKFLYSSLSAFPPQKIMEWFESRGVPLKTERGRRVFPESDSAADIAETIVKECERHGVEVLHARADSLMIENGAISGVMCGNREYGCKNVILATGGRSYPKTGSDGSGYNIAKAVGHTIVKPQPSLVPIETQERFCRLLDGLTLKNVTLSLYDLDKPKRPVFSEQGEFTFTDYGVSGPLALSASCLMDEDKTACKGYKLVIDFKPALSYEQLDARILRDIEANPKASVGELLSGLLPMAMVSVFAEVCDVGLNEPVSGLTRETRNVINEHLKQFELRPKSLRSFDEAIVTRGGVAVKEILPQTMESRVVKGLYFAGEIIDCDGFTGGYNLTIAFATAHAAASDIIKNKEVEKWD